MPGPTQTDGWTEGGREGGTEEGTAAEQKKAQGFLCFLDLVILKKQAFSKFLHPPQTGKNRNQENGRSNWPPQDKDFPPSCQEEISDGKGKTRGSLAKMSEALQRQTPLA